MKRLSFTSITLLCFIGNIYAQAPELGGYGEYKPPISECVSPTDRIRIDAMLEENIAQLKASGKLPMDWGKSTEGKAKPTAGNFIWPLQNASGLNYKYNYGISNFVDLDPLYPNHLLDWNCGARTYDLANGNHGGIDIFIWPFGQYLQENSLVEIIAAADGIIIGKEDGNFDHNCAMSNSANWNAVYIGNTDGTICWYGHMKKNSTTSKIVGQSVTAGEVLGIVGSSGSSTGPHLHFETHSNTGNIIEPFSGPCNNIQSLWASQKPYMDPHINAIMTHNHAPVFPDCPQMETINDKDTFLIGDTLFVASYFHDQTNVNAGHYTITNPINEVKSWDYVSNQPHYVSSYRYWYWKLDNTWAEGEYTYEVAYEGDTLKHNFWVFKTMPSGINDVEEHKNFISIVPNPNNGNFDLNINQDYFKKESSVVITNVNGIRFFEGVIPENKAKLSLNLNLRPGVYYLKAIDAMGNQLTKPFVVY